MQAVSDPNAPTLEVAVLSVLLDAETARHGAQLLLDALALALDDDASALAIRDRDGTSIHVVAERGRAVEWPARLEPQLAGGMHAGVDRETGVMAVPLRARGRVVGFLLLGDPSAAGTTLQRPDLNAVLGPVASVLHALMVRADAEQKRRGAAARALDSIADGMAHQITNPLTGASAIAELLAVDVTDEGHRAAVQQIRHELGRAFLVISDALDFHRDTRAHDGILDLNTVVERVTRFRGYSIREQGIAMAVVSAPEFLPVRADSRALEYALQLVLRSAELRSHGKANRRIDVQVDRTDMGECVVRVSDSGPGTVPDFSPRFFDLPIDGNALPSPPDDEPDLGLAQSIIRGMGGRIDVSASKLDGTTLTVVVPRAAFRPTPVRGVAV